MSSIRCPHHPNTEPIEDYRAGDLVCPDCGLVIGDRLVDIGTEWRSFSNENSPGNDPSRVGAPERPFGGFSDLSTSITIGFGASEGAQKLFISQQRSKQDNKQRQIFTATSTIREMSERIHLPRPIQDRALEYFTRCVELKAMKGKNVEARTAACLYIACRKENVPRSFKEICAVSRVSKKEIGRCFKLAAVALEKESSTLSQVTTADYMSRFCGNLGLPKHIKHAASIIADRAGKLDTDIHQNPTMITAAAIYLACNAGLVPEERKTAKTIGEICGAAESTIKKYYKLLRPRVEDLLPKSFKFAGPIDSIPFC
ncbi:hypothetical protein L596_001293 [Steinernema carpocapsae]|uniref:Transcription initiation factor IIB n=1 Tax=Steinernema carpocapsae TaxID=34508 RepID=A0A4U8ULV8_STECR|nr:hypothetical protein L596_001293 [Steinernema carpocapsae]